MFEGIITQYGLLGLFISALIGSTIFIPFSVEAVILFIVKESNVDLYIIIIVASIGALIGTWVNYGLGYLGSSFIKKRYDHGRIDHASKIMNKYGWPGLFVIIAIPLPLPIPVDPITIVPGIARMNFIEFSIVVLLAKLVRYSIVAGIFNGLLGIHF